MMFPRASLTAQSNNRRKIGRRIPGNLVPGLVMAGLLVLTGCDPEPFGSGLASALIPIQIQKNAQTALMNAETARNAANAAAGATCDAAAPYRAQAEFAAQVAEGEAQLAAEVAAKADAAFNLMGSADNLLSQMSDLRSQSAAGLEAPQAAFLRFFRDGNLLNTANPDNMLDTANDYLTALRQSKTNLQIATDAFSDALATTKLGDWITDPEDAGALATDMQQLNEELSLALGQAQSAQGFGSFQDQMEALRNVGARMDVAWRRLNWKVGGAIRNAKENLRSFVFQSRSQVSNLSYSTYLQAAEATRNAWLAIEACGGDIPPDLPPLDSPFQWISDTPAWNSTFWDISSP